MKLLRLALLVLSVSLVSTACQMDSITAPEPESGGTWLGSGGQIAPSGGPSFTGGTWLGSGG